MTAVAPFPAGDWDSLDLRDIAKFLAADPSEGALWEAKQHATKGELAGFVREEVCGFSNRHGGYLLLGAEDHKPGWSLSGVEVKNVKELHDWIASLLRELQPVPIFDVKEWSLPTGRKVALAKVDQADLPPVSFKGTVFIRHGSQTIRADGPAIRRLAEAGARQERKLKKAAVDQATLFARDLWAPFGLALARPGRRTYDLSSQVPEDVSEKRLGDLLRSRWRQREIDRLIWHSPPELELRDFGFQGKGVKGGWQHDPPVHKGWRVAYQVEEKPRVLKKSPFPRSGERDIWMLYLYTDCVSAGSQSVLPVRSTPMGQHYGLGAIKYATLLFRALLSIELELGADVHEPLFSALVLSPWSRGDAGATIELASTMSVKPRDWASDVFAEAKRHLRPA